MVKKKSVKYELCYEITSERNKIAGYTLIPKNNHSAEAQHMNEHKAFQAIQRHALKGGARRSKQSIVGISRI